MNLIDKSQLIKYLKQNDLWAKKSLGQNFLVDRSVLDKIIAAAELRPSDTVIEIGPGIGTLTSELVKNAGKVIAVEKDDKLAELLKRKYARTEELKKLKILRGDVLDLDLMKLVKLDPSQASYKVVANIPYYITSKILEKFLSADNKPELIVLLVQKEVAERICAKPRSTSSRQGGDMSVLSIAVQYYGDPEIVDVVKSSSFWPQPKIDSAILKISNFKCHMSDVNEADLFKIVRAGFRSRRKTLVNNLMTGTQLSREELFDILEKIGLDKNVRAQELTIEEWIRLCQMLDVK